MANDTPIDDQGRKEGGYAAYSHFPPLFVLFFEEFNIE